MQNLRSKDRDIPDFDRFGFRPLLKPSDVSSSGQQLHHHRHTPSPKPVSPAVSPRGSAKPASTTQNTDEFVQDALQTHNDLRRRHGVERLKLNDELTALAQKWGMYNIVVVLSEESDFVLFLLLKPIILQQPKL